MNFKSLKLKNYRKFSDFKVDFQPGINVVFGENERGKSTLLSAIMTVLYADPSTRSRAFLDDILPWSGKVGPIGTTGTSEGALLTLEFQADDKTYMLTKDFAKRIAKFENLTNKKNIEDISLINDTIAKLTRLPTAEIFRSTAMIKQKEVALVESSSDLRKAVQNSISGAEDANIEEAKKEVARQINNLIVGLNRPAKNLGKIKTLQNEFAQLQVEYEESKKEWEKLISARQVGESSSQGLDEILSKIELLEKLIENHNKFQDSQKELKKLDEQIKANQRIVSKIEELNVKLKQIDSKSKEYSDLNTAEIEDELVNIANLEGRIVTKQKMLKNAGQTRKVADSQSNKKLVLLGAAMAIAGVVGSMFVNTYFLALVVLGLVVLVYSAYAKNVAKQSTSIDSQLKGIEQSILSEKQAIENILDRYKVRNVSELNIKKLRKLTIEENGNNLRSEMKGVLAGRTLQEIQDKQLELMTRRQQIEKVEMTEEVKNSNLTPQEYLSKRRELDSLKIKKNSIQRQQVQSEVRIEDSTVNYDTIVLLEENIERLKKEMEQAEFELKSLELISEALENATTDLSAKFQEIIVKTVEKDLAQITNNKYKQIKVGKDFDVSVFAEEKGDWAKPAENLSAGTVDQIFFLFRLSLLKAIEEGTNMPLLLDDPFVTFDKNRLEETRKILEREAGLRQVILFTHSEVFKNWGNLVQI